MNEIPFKSDPGNFWDEYIGLKPNTTRLVDPQDERFNVLRKFASMDLSVNTLYIKILITEHKAGMPDYFRREIKNIKFFWITPAVEICIISWRA